MDGSISSPYDRMLTSLRGTFNRRLPGGLSDTADKRLQRTLDHYIKQVVRVQGTINEQEILRESFDSMAGWFRRNTAALGGSPVPVTSVAPSPTLPTVMTAVSTEPPLAMNEEEDPLVLFERLKAARKGAATVAPPLPSQPLMELTAVETRPKPPVVSVPASFTSTPLDAIFPPSQSVTQAAVFPPSQSVTQAAVFPPSQSVTQAAVFPPSQSVTQAAVFPPSQSKDILQRQDDVVKYRESEYNVVLNSKDRNWFLNRTENRYNFTVQLNGGATPQGRGYQPTLMNRLKNIVRLEFIKAILPVEGLEVVVPRACDPSGTEAIPESAFVSALSFPFVQVILDEQTGNNIGTTDTVDRSLAICQYDATWKSDQTHDPTHSRGYTLFFPKFMKAQRIFAPTPLASLQNLHFQLLNPEGLPVSCIPDSLTVNRILSSADLDASGTCYWTPGDNRYLFIRTSEYFPMWSFSKYDRITFAGLSVGGSAPAGFDALAAWLSRLEGHLVLGIGYGNTSVTIDRNDCGYANWVVIQNRTTDPATDGTCAHLPFAADESGLADLTLTAGAVLNLSRQVQLFLRVVTREVDSGTNVRPDNI